MALGLLGGRRRGGLVERDAVDDERAAARHAHAAVVDYDRLLAVRIERHRVLDRAVKIVQCVRIRVCVRLDHRRLDHRIQHEQNQQKRL